MRNTMRIAMILAVVFSFVLVQSAIAGKPLAPVAGDPIWKILVDGTAQPVPWVDADNPRFAVWGQLVLDKETGLIWAKDANPVCGTGVPCWTFEAATNYCRNDMRAGNRRGWRLPTVDELATLIDDSASQPPTPRLPYGHPFDNVQHGDMWDRYVTSTLYEGEECAACKVWSISFHYTNVVAYDYTGFQELYYVWCVRGGN